MASIGSIEMTEETAAITTEVPKKKGWPKGKKRKLAVQALDREPMREELRPIDDLVYTPQEDEDRLQIDQSIIPDGMTYQWITHSVFGQDIPTRRSRFMRQHWVPVMAERHDGLFMPKGYKGQIEIDGLGLYERPKKITKMARDYEYQKATGQVRIKEQQLIGGHIEGVTLDTQHPSALRSNTVNRTIERISIPKD